MAILNSKGEKVDGSLIAIYEESGQMLHKPSGKWYTTKEDLAIILKEELENNNNKKA